MVISDLDKKPAKILKKKPRLKLRRPRKILPFANPKSKLVNFLTIGRIIAIPIVLIFIYIGIPELSIIALILFSTAGITDIIDGYLARKWKIVSSFGRFLDPIADKLLVISTLIILLIVRDYSIFFELSVLIIILREIIVSGLREFLAQSDKIVKVSRISKIKTFIQMLATGFLIFPNSESLISILIRFTGETLLTIAAIITVKSGYDYLRQTLLRIIKGKV